MGSRRARAKGRTGRRAELTLRIGNTHCAHRLASNGDAVTRLEDVRGDAQQQFVTVTYRQGRADPDGIREAVIERGSHISEGGR